MTSGDQGEKKTESEFALKSERQAPQNLASNSPWRAGWPFFERAIAPLAGSNVPSKIAAWLGPPVTAQMVRNWRLGRYGIPAWAIEKTRLTLHQAADGLSQVLPSAGPRNDIASKRRGDRWAHKRKNPAP